jgi:hypothetical protein
VVPVPEIKLVRTDTTLDLSQKAEKVWVHLPLVQLFRRPCRSFRLGGDMLFYFRTLLCLVRKCTSRNPRIRNELQLSSIRTSDQLPEPSWLWFQNAQIFRLLLKISVESQTKQVWLVFAVGAIRRTPINQEKSFPCFFLCLPLDISMSLFFFCV